MMRPPRRSGAPTLPRLIAGAVGLSLLTACVPVQQGVSRVAGLGPSATEVGSSTRQFVARVEAGAPVKIVALEDRGGALTSIVQMTDSAQGGQWRTPDNVGFALQDGFLLGTAALGNDLMTADIAETRALVLAGRDGLAVRVHRYLDGQNATLIRSFVCDVTIGGPAPLVLDNRSFDTRLVTETCRNPDLSFENYYWIGGGRILQSKQWVGPQVGYVSMREVILG
ncbi:YjbF family lipoprotein [Frigidibacter oleivorans]|uniref:YjbF family lipoprotein n=1 Tax=Frigidibacter oleivorans TaxID=2487129 RepID=UPI000F8DD06F|nr:YjbF family lipoprotein [Frigidibacter oleivorans]